jgi:hypothetical protein
VGCIVAAVAVETVRQRVATALEAVSGWSASTYLGELWPTSNMLGVTPHKRFSVATPTTTTIGRRETDAYRNRPGGSAVNTRVDVQWMYRVRADAQVTDYDAALTAERSLAAAAVTDPTGTDVRWVLVSCARTLQSDGEASFIVGVISIDALHQLDLE